ncbi:porin family protein [Chitinophaga flava]|uniref:Outer membrane protein beta-barrel domain-containing protein n=1 Tax=Chitinophaga flava TaxID=2259036 RepID=A0A365Y1S1_9BACT|nr:porin family protein [Chitinophaga flava]RBL92559.1 hypothetical protein DF182_08245 [Chitinophaga flava]
MRKTLLVPSFVLTAVLGAYAQKKISYGLKGGLNYFNYTGNFDKYRTSIYGGGFAEITISQRWAMQPEVVYYKNRGYGLFNYERAQHSGSTSLVNSTRKEHYISVPIMIKYYAIPKLYIEAGPELNFLIESTEQQDGHRYGVADYYNNDRTTLNLSMGGGYQLPYGFGINARFSVGVHSKGQTPITYNNTGKVGFTYTINHK